LAELATAQGQPFLPGDFNEDGSVNAADYVVWRKGLGTTHTQSDYAVWRANFGAGSAGVGAGSGTTGYPLGASAAPLSAAVPEPATPALDGETTARDEAFSTLAPSRGFGHERRSRFASFGRELSAQPKPLNDKYLLALCQGILRPGRDFSPLPIYDDAHVASQEEWTIGSLNYDAAIVGRRHLLGDDTCPKCSLQGEPL
jgi:hypothetical protein